MHLYDALWELTAADLRRSFDAGSRVCAVRIPRMPTLPACPQCKSELTYQDGTQYVCPECAHEWNETADPVGPATEDALVVRDAFGNTLRDGDSITVIKDLKVKGSSSVVKVGTKVKGIRLVDSDNGHNIDCRIEGIGAMQLKSEFVKKA
jgi:protein PhnA